MSRTRRAVAHIASYPLAASWVSVMGFAFCLSALVRGF